MDLHDTKIQILQHIESNPGICQKDLADKTGKSGSTISDHMEDLQEEGLVEDKSGPIKNQKEFHLDDSVSTETTVDYRHLMDNYKVHVVESFTFFASVIGAPWLIDLGFDPTVVVAVVGLLLILPGMAVSLYQSQSRNYLDVTVSYDAE